MWTLSLLCIASQTLKKGNHSLLFYTSAETCFGKPTQSYDLGVVVFTKRQFLLKEKKMLHRFY